MLVSRRRLYFALLLFFCTPAARAQITNVTNTTSTPIPGAGHDYIQALNETVNPANGSVSLRIQVPTPPGRKISLPFSFAYDSGGAQHLQPDGTGLNFWVDNTEYLAKGGWSYSVPMISNLQVTEPAGRGRCTYYSNYVFQDETGGRHPLYLSIDAASAPCAQATPIVPVQRFSGGDDYYQATLTAASGPSPVLVASASGTVFSFGLTSHPGGVDNVSTALVSSIEDRNGNALTVTDLGLSNGSGAFNVKDALGRTLLSSSSFGASGDTITVSGLSNPYTVAWGSNSANHAVNSVLLQSDANGCNGIPNLAGPPSVVKQITLPNNTSYAFSYDSSYGLLSKITYPGGGFVSYSWTLNPLSEFQALPDALGGGNTGCLWQYDTPAVAQRSVSFDGVHIALQQTFSYSTTWSSNPKSWTTKTTTVTTTDNITGLTYTTVYTYSAYTAPRQPNDYSPYQPQIAVEQTVVTKNSSGTTLRTLTKTWYDEYELKSQQTTLDNGQTSQTTYTYGSGAQITEQDDYDFGSGAPGALSRKTVTNYQAFNATPIYPSAATIFDRPCQVTTYDGSGTNRVAETDYFYDGTTSSTPCSAATTQALPGPGNYTGHDETHYGTNATPSRANLTTKSVWINGSGSKLTTASAYDETGQLTSSTDPRGNQTAYSYADNFSSGTPPAPTNAYLTQITYPNTGTAHIEKYGYAYSSGKLTSSIDQNNLTTTYMYNDSLARLTETDFPDGGVTTIAYNDSPYNPSTPSPSVTTAKKINTSTNLVTVSATDGLGQIVTSLVTSDPQGTIHTDAAFDGLGHTYTVSNPYRTGTDPTTSSGTTTYTYDALGRKIKETDPDGSALTTAYCGPSTLVTDPTGKWRRSRVDSLGRLVEVDEPNAVGAAVNSNGCPGTGEPIWVTSYTVDTLGNLKQVVQNASHQRNFSYDFLSRLTSVSNPESGATTYNYDSDINCSGLNSFAGLLVSKVDARGIRTCAQYDALNRETVLNYSNGDPTLTTTYDQSNCLGLSTCQNIGHRTSLNDAAGSEAWSYQIDATNHRSIHVDQRTTTSSPSNVTKTSTYYLDLAGNVTQAIYPTGRIVNYTYNAANRPITAVDGTNGIAYATDFQSVPSGCLANAVCYTPQGTFYAHSIGQSTSFTGLNLTHSYNNRLQPLEFKASSSAGNAIDITYSFVDPSTNKNAGHVFSITNNLDGTRSQTFSYDQLNRITAAQTTSTFATSPGHCWGETYGLDAWANLQSISATTDSRYTGCSQESGFSRPADGNNHLSGFSYDSSGNTQNDGSFTYNWDAESQLKSAGGINYLYDADGRRVAKVASKLYWYGAGGDILAETDASGNATAEYIFFGGKRVAMLPVGGNPIYYVEDLLGTSRVITQNNGVVCYDADFYPYGGERSYTNTCPQNYKFEGKERDAETGNDDFGARYYSNRFGRWLSADWSAVPVPVPYANLTNPQTLNLYAMVADDPESFADLDGHGAADALSSPPACSTGCTDPSDMNTKQPGTTDQNAQPQVQAAQGAAVAAGETLINDATVRANYAQDAAALSGPDASAARSALQGQAYNQLSPVGQATTDILKASRTGQLAGKTAAQLEASAATTNAGVNAAGGAAKAAGTVLVVAAVAMSTYNVATAPAGKRGAVAAREGGALLGATAGGIAGAKLGAIGGSFFGPVGTLVGAAGGALIGGGLGAIAGSRAGTDIYNYFAH